jgi:hypothetical protein
MKLAAASVAAWAVVAVMYAALAVGRLLRAAQRLWWRVGGWNVWGGEQ